MFNYTLDDLLINIDWCSKRYFEILKNFAFKIVFQEFRYILLPKFIKKKYSLLSKRSKPSLPNHLVYF